MPLTPHQEAIARGHFLMVCSGETYSADIIKGTELLDKMFEAMYGDAKEGHPEEREAYRAELADPDNWHHDQDYGPTRWSTDVGETDRIDIIRITDTAPAMWDAVNAKLQKFADTHPDLFAAPKS
jgi:hypothetical protein